MQRGRELPEIVALCSAHPLVSEILIVNNVDEPLRFAEPKVRVLDQGENIGVNPAWNLGVRETTAEYLAILNDDILFDPEVFDYARRLLDRGWGLVGPDSSCLNTEHRGPVSHRIASGVGEPFGTMMMLRRENYVPIPEDLRIWGGDDWLWLLQRRPSAALVGTSLWTEMSTTSSDPEHRQDWARQQELMGRHLEAVGFRRWWHAPVRGLRRVRRLRAAAGSALRGLAGRRG